MMSLNEETVEEIEQAIKDDATFLANRNLMDYSLLLGVEQVKVKDCNDEHLNENRNKRLGISVNVEQDQDTPYNPTLNEETSKTQNLAEVYHIGIIDYLQEWNLQKKGENFAKTFFKPDRKPKLSAIPPQKYRTRFIDFMSGKVFRPSVRDGESNSVFIRGIKFWV